jgi:hypothetical protein
VADKVIAAAVGVATWSPSGNRRRADAKTARMEAAVRLALAEGVDPHDADELRRRMAEAEEE